MAAKNQNGVIFDYFYDNRYIELIFELSHCFYGRQTVDQQILFSDHPNIFLYGKIPNAKIY
jgi:hypothetical protein